MYNNNNINNNNNNNKTRYVKTDNDAILSTTKHPEDDHLCEPVLLEGTLPFSRLSLYTISQITVLKFTVAGICFCWCKARSLVHCHHNPLSLPHFDSNLVKSQKYLVLFVFFTNDYKHCRVRGKTARP